MEQNISLTGMSGAGKTSTAIELGKLLSGCAVVDTDELIIKDTKLTIPEIFEKFGEEYFRKKETDVVTDIFKNKNQVVSLGGGAFENNTNRKIIKENSFVVYLKTKPETILNRLKNTNDRPLLSNNISTENIQKMLTKRKANYEKSDIIIETDNKTPTEVAVEIIRALKL